MDGNGPHVSMAALRARGLATTEGRGPTRSTALTQVGRTYLEMVDSGDGSTPRAPVGVTATLVDEISAAGGVLTVDRGDRWSGGVDHETRARAAVRHGRVPDGQRLIVTPRSHGRVELRLVDVPATPDTADVRVPERVARLHPAARTVRERPVQFRIARASAGRAARIVHALPGRSRTRGSSSFPSIRIRGRRHGDPRCSGR
jgi:hypothetical protein